MSQFSILQSSEGITALFFIIMNKNTTQTVLVFLFVILVIKCTFRIIYYFGIESNDMDNQAASELSELINEAKFGANQFEKGVIDFYNDDLRGLYGIWPNQFKALNPNDFEPKTKENELASSENPKVTTEPKENLEKILYPDFMKVGNKYMENPSETSDPRVATNQVDISSNEEDNAMLREILGMRQGKFTALNPNDYKPETKQNELASSENPKVTWKEVKEVLDPDFKKVGGKGMENELTSKSLDIINQVENKVNPLSSSEEPSLWRDIIGRSPGQFKVLNPNDFEPETKENELASSENQKVTWKEVKEVLVPDFKKVGNKSYHIENSEKRDWYKANDECEKIGGELATLQSEEEWIAVKEKLQMKLDYWVDIDNVISDAKFMTGFEPDWATNIRININNCIELKGYNNHQVNGENCNVKNNFICEKNNS